MSTKQTEALKLALEALEYPINTSSGIFDADVAELKTHRAIAALHDLLEDLQSDYRAMYLKVRDELAALQQSRATDDELNCVCGAVWKGDELVHTPRTKTPLTSKEIRAIEVDVATNLSLDYPSPAEQFTRAIEARHGIK